MPPNSRVHMSRCLPWLCSAALLLVACDDGDGGGGGAPAELPYDTLSEYGFFEGAMAEMRPAEGVVPFVVNAPLWADHAGKDRFFVLPEGTSAVADDEEPWVFPVGSVVIKNFWYSKDRRDPEGTATLVETRLLIAEVEGWTGHTYLWDAAQSEAVRKVAGKRLELSFVDEAGAPATQTYVLPNTNQCKTCHERDDRLELLGPVTRQLARTVERDGVAVDQLSWLAEQGVVASAPGVPETTMTDPFGDGPLEARARSYLEANCGHCHRDGGHGGPSGLVLEVSETRPQHFGVCKSPVAAGPGSGGHLHDIEPGHPERSIMVFRMESTDPDLKMPEIPNLIPDRAGIELVSEWIAAMEPAGCEPSGE